MTGGEVLVPQHLGRDPVGVEQGGDGHALLGAPTGAGASEVEVEGFEAGQAPQDLASGFSATSARTSTRDRAVALA